METTAKVLSEISMEVSMPKKLYVGDPLYFEEYEGAKLKSLTYAKSFRGKSDWIGKVKLTQKEDSFEMGGEVIKYIDLEIEIYLAPNEKLLNIYADNMKFSYQKTKTVDIGVDSASYVLGVNDREIKVSTMSDGFFGTVMEFYNKSKLEGITIGLSTGEHSDFERVKSELEYLFDIKFA